MGRGFLDYEKEHKAFLWQNPLFVLFPKRTYEMDNQTLIWNVKVYDGTGGQPIAGCPLRFRPLSACPFRTIQRWPGTTATAVRSGCRYPFHYQRKLCPGNPVRSPWEPCPVAPQSRYSGTGCMDWENSLRHRHRFHNL